MGKKFENPLIFCKFSPELKSEDGFDLTNIEKNVLTSPLQKCTKNK